jgi:pimeloyl-ACP methyl ester carboxylesterase
MECRIGGVLIHYDEHGEGLPLVALHGAGVDHREIEAAIEAVVPHAGCRRIYPDLPGMGQSTADGLAGNDDVVNLLGNFIESECSAPVMLLGHSYGAYLARGVAARYPDLVRGLALVCPISEHSGHLPPHRVVLQDAEAFTELEPQLWAGFDDYFVIRTVETAIRYRDSVAPGTTLVDERAVGRIFANWAVDIRGAFEAPTLIVAGRQDSTVGYEDAANLLALYPQATLAILDAAGHALPHEQPALLGALVVEWIARGLAGATG